MLQQTNLLQGILAVTKIVSVTVVAAAIFFNRYDSTKIG